MLGASLIISACSSTPESISADTLITDVDIIDVQSGEVRPDQYVAIRGEEVIWVGDNAKQIQALNTLDGTDKFDNCFLGLKKCNGDNPCPVHFIVAPFKETILAVFRDKTIEKYVSTMEGTRQVITLKHLDKL